LVKKIKINGDKKKAIDNLVKQYGRLFSRAPHRQPRGAATHQGQPTKPTTKKSSHTAVIFIFALS